MSALLADVRLPTRNPGALVRFYSALGLRIEAPQTVRVGPSRLAFVDDPTAPPSHFAFSIPYGALEPACAWLAERRISRLAGPDGRTRFAFMPWQARAVYFRDAGGHIVELIERERRGVDWTGAKPFGADAWLELSEIALAVPDPAHAARRLDAALGLAPFPPGTVVESDTDFAAVGDESGLVVLVRTGRPWFPENTTPAEAVAVQVRVRGRPSDWTVLDGPGARVAGAGLSP